MPVIFMLGSLLSHAQTGDTIKNYLINEVVISATRTEKKILEIPKSVSLITKQEIRSSGAASLAELISSQESLSIIGSNQTPGSNQSFFLRGIDGEHTIIMIDGIRISDPSSNTNSLDLSEISLIDVDRVEIVRGSHSTLYGSSAIGGVINIITGQNLKKGAGINANLDFGTFGPGTSQFNENFGFDYGFANGFFAGGKVFRSDVRGLDAVLDTVKSEGVFKNNDKDNFSKTDMLIKAGYNGNRLQTMVVLKHTGQLSDIDQRAFVNDENNTIDLSRDMLNYSLRYQLNDRLHLLFKGGGSSVIRTNENDSSLVSAGEYDGNYYAGTFKGKQFTGELQMDYVTDNLRMVFGGGLYHESMTSRSYTFSSKWNYEAIADLDTLQLHNMLANLYLSADIDGEMISDRFTGFSMMLGFRLNSDNRHGRFLSFEFNPYYKISQGFILYGSISTGFNAPSLYKLYTPESNYLSGISRGNPSLRPERSLSTELGIKQLLGKNLVITLAAYRNEILKSIQYVYLWDKTFAIEMLRSDWTRDDFRGDTYLNLGSLTTKGVELSFWTKIGNRITIKGNMNLQSGLYKYDLADILPETGNDYHVQLFESGRFLDQNVKINKLSRRSDNLNLYADCRLTRSTNLAIGILRTGKKNDIFYSAGIQPFGGLDYKSLKGYTLCNLLIRQQINNNLFVSLRVQNLFNKRYTELLGYSTRGRGLYINLDFAL